MSFARVELFWSQFLGVSEEALRNPGVTVVPHKGLGSYPGAWLFVHSTSGIVSCPESWVLPLRAALSGASAAMLHDVAYLSGLFQVDTAEMVGPSYQGYVEAREFRPDRRRPVRALSASDRPMLEALFAASSPEERSDSGIDPDRPLSMGSFADGRLVSVAQSRELSPDASDPCVLTRPSHRSAGHATAVVSAVVEQALRQGALVLYQTLLSNSAATRLAQRLGFRRFASHVAIRRL